MSEQVLRFLQEKPKREIQFGYSRISQELLPTFEIKTKVIKITRCVTFNFPYLPNCVIRIVNYDKSANASKGNISRRPQVFHYF